MNIAENYHLYAGYNMEPENLGAIRKLKSDYHRINFMKPLNSVIARGKKIRVLEFGPGIGCLIDLVLSDYPDAEYHIADIDRDSLLRLQADKPGLITHHCAGQADLLKIEGMFDVVIAIDVWEHLDLDVAIFYTRWCYEHLNAGGMMMLEVPNWGCPLTPSVFCLDLTHKLMFNEHSVRQLCRVAGVPEGLFKIIPRKTPYILGAVRDGLGYVFGLCYRLSFMFFGAVRLTIFTPDLVTIIHK